MPFGRLQIGPGLVEAVDKCVQLVNEKLLDYVARGQAQLQATGMQPNIPPTMLDEQMNYVPIVAKEIDAAAQLAELQDLGPAYPGGIVKELTIPANLMGGIIGPRQSTLAQIRKAAKVRIEIASQPKVGVVSEGVLRVGPAPPEIIAKCEELIQIKSEELLGQRPRSNPMTFGAIAETLSNGGQMPGGGGKGGPPPGFPTARGPNYGHGKGQAPTGQEECPPGMEFQEVEVPKELMGAMIGTQGSGIERLKSSFAAAGFQMGVSISQNPARDATVDVGKLRLGPGVPEQVMEASRIVAARVEECRQMRDASKGIGKPDGGKFDGGKGKGYGKFKGSDKGKGAAPGPYSGYGNPQMNPHMNGNPQMNPHMMQGGPMGYNPMGYNPNMPPGGMNMAPGGAAPMNMAPGMQPGMQMHPGMQPQMQQPGMNGATGSIPTAQGQPPAAPGQGQQPGQPADAAAQQGQMPGQMGMMGMPGGAANMPGGMGMGMPGAPGMGMDAQQQMMMMQQQMMLQQQMLMQQGGMPGMMPGMMGPGAAGVPPPPPGSGQEPATATS